MSWKKGIIDVTWNEISFKSLSYFKEPFNDGLTTESWSNVYGNIFSTGWMVDYRSHQPAWAKDVANRLGIDKAGTSFYRMEPGQILPYHSDTYSRYCEYNNVQPQDVWRAIVFLEDWKPGHIFEIDGNPITEWRAGEYIIWNNDVPHLAANLGPDNRYTLQVTGVKADGLDELF